MDANLRPDLTRILPRPLLQPRGGLRFDDIAVVPSASESDRYLVDVERKFGGAPGDAGYDLGQAKGAAEQVNRALGRAPSPPALFAIDPGRAQRLLS